MIEFNDAALASAGAIGGVILTKLIERFFEKKSKAEDKAEDAENARLDRLEETVHRMELALAGFSAQMQLVLPNLNSLGKLKEDLAGFYKWHRDTKQEGR